jgi:hypothetical protein
MVMRSSYRILFLIVSHAWNLSALSESRLEIFGRQRTGPTPFANVPVNAGASPAAAANTLQELKTLLEDKIYAGEITEEDARKILSDAYGRLSPLASGVKAGTTSTISVAKASAPATPTVGGKGKTVIVLAAPIKKAPRAPEEATTPTPDANANSATNSPLPSAVGNLKSEFGPSSAQAFNELDGLLSHRKVGRSAEPLHRASVDSDGATAAARGTVPRSIYGSPGAEEVSEIRPTETMPTRALANFNGAPRARPLPPLPIRRDAVSGTRAPLFGGTSGAGLLDVPRYKLGTDEAGVFDFGDGSDGSPMGLDWIFATAMAGLVGRAIYQWRRART